MTAPLVPAIVDLRDFHYMPLDVVRLRDSKIVSHTSGEGFRCAVLLWCVSWHQVPAASLPDDDVLLSQYAGFGRSVREWKRYRAEALHGWVMCDDGRWYHPTVAEKALEAWAQRLQQRWRTECSRIKKAAQRAGVSPIYPSFEEWEAHLEATGSEHWRPANVPGDKTEPSPETGADCPPNVPGETTSKGREGKGRDISRAEEPKHAEGSRSPNDAGRACLLMRQAGCTGTNPSHPDLLAALAEGVTPEQLADTAREAIDSGKSKPFAWAITAARGRRAQGAKPVNGATHATDRPRESDADRAARRAAEIAERTGIDLS